MNLESTASTSTNSGGLGFLNANHVEMELNLEIVPPAVVADEPRARVKGRRKEKEKKKESISVDVRVVQDPSALRARSGDTGEYEEGNALTIQAVFFGEARAFRARLS